MKKGFTLIELLAVIVILAIIALIATPIVLNIINDTKESAVLRSADFYINALENEIALENMKLGGNLNPKECIIGSDGNATCDEVLLEIEVDGEKPNSGSIKYDNGKVIDVILTFGDKTISMNSKGELILGEVQKACSLSKDEDSDGVADVGDMITCSTESFYVINNDEETITMLAKYNLDAGKILIKDPYSSDEIQNATGVQSASAGIYNANEEANEVYGVIEFSNNDYWYDWTNNVFVVDANYQEEGRSYPYVYNNQSIIYPYIEKYKEKLQEMNVNVKEARLISYDEVQNLKNNYNNPSWIYETGDYWTGSVNTGYDADYAWNVDGGLSLLNGGGNWFGIRSVISISVNEI